MKCKNCGAILLQKGANYVCPYCNANYVKEELVPTKEINEVIVTSRKIANEFVIRGGVLCAYNGSKKEIVIPEGVLSIGVGAFKNNLAINKVIFASSVKSVENNAFEGCLNLLEISNYQNVEKYGDESFKFSGLKEIFIGKAVRSLGRNCFSGMPNLKKVSYSPNKNLKLNKTFANCKNLIVVNVDRNYFFPALIPFLTLRKNTKNERYTYYDAFFGTPFFENVKQKIKSLCKENVCIDCGGQLRKGLFRKKCKKCGIVYEN